MMISINRCLSCYRSIVFHAAIAVLLVSIMLPVPISANTANYYVAEDGASFSAEITLINQSSYPFTSLGLNGDSAISKVMNLTLTAENGTVVDDIEKSSTQILFPKGNYTLTYEAPVDGYFIYGQYLYPFNSTVFLPEDFHTNNLFLGPVYCGGKTYLMDDERINLVDLGIDVVMPQYKTIITWVNKREIQMRFYPKYYEKYFVICVGLWFLLFCVAGYRYIRLRIN